ncbi:hypothetical protein BH11MYX1_BH11MYX1_15520 [soil metagenome]
MIGPGWLPTRPLRLKRTLAYIRVRRRAVRPRPKPRLSGPAGAACDDMTVVFQSGPVEFPVATLRARDPKTQAHVLIGDFRRWLLSTLTWLRPRTVPFVVAALGLLAVLASADYLQHVKVSPMHHSSTASR